MKIGHCSFLISNGATTILCMYAPEFTSHSEGMRVGQTALPLPLLKYFENRYIVLV
ncbi:MAG: hypothetical protein AB8G11_20660 [Saprospiraceae bacterium]